jgi:hypothetical protein
MPQNLFASERRCPMIGRCLCGTINTAFTMMLFHQEGILFVDCNVAAFHHFSVDIGL